jgi:hypothetical protein
MCRTMPPALTGGIVVLLTLLAVRRMFWKRQASRYATRSDAATRATMA